MVRDTIWVVFMKATEFDQTRRRPRTVLEQICRHQKHRCLPDAMRAADYFDAIPRALPAGFITSTQTSNYGRDAGNLFFQTTANVFK